MKYQCEFLNMWLLSSYTLPEFIRLLSPTDAHKFLHELNKVCTVKGRFIPFLKVTLVVSVIIGASVLVACNQADPIAWLCLVLLGFSQFIIWKMFRSYEFWRGLYTKAENIILNERNCECFDQRHYI